MKFFSAIILVLILLFTGCKNEPVDYQALDEFSQFQQISWNKTLTDVMVADIFTPPVCSRIYAYPHIAAYEVLAKNNEGAISFAGALAGLNQIPEPLEGKEIYYPLASIIAFSTSAKPLVYAFEKIDSAEIIYLEKIKKIGIPEKLFNNSVEYGMEVGQHIINWSAKDGYLERSALPQYELSKEAGKWQPTPPDYMPAIEPHWNTMRTFVIESARQFRKYPPTEFSSSKKSKFFNEANIVAQTVRELDKEKVAIAKFWDCNPNISHTKGHLMFYDQKISPGGHWMSITGIASKQNNLSPIEIAKVHALTSITLFDAFISCWDEKYQSSLIRPETFINQFIDPDWKPLLQTPAFPEHTSGHSVISSAAAVMLTKIFGDKFSFNDTSEMDYGLPARKFDSFFDASEEAAISRLYGGIHYMPAIEKGVMQGKEVGNFVTNKLKIYLAN